MIIRRIIPAIATLVLVGVAPTTLAESSYADVQRFSDNGVVDGSSTLLRTDNGVAYSLNTSELGKKFAYTNWFVNFNNPEDCTTPCACGDVDFDKPDVEIGVFWATGRVADKYGQAVFAANANYGELPTGFDQVPFAPDFNAPIKEGAEIHIVVRSHGKASKDPDELASQLFEFNGLCDDGGDDDDDDDGDDANVCADVQFAVHRSPTCS